MKKILLFFSLFTTALLFAQNPVELPLWPDKAPNNSRPSEAEQNYNSEWVTNITVPTLTIFPASQPNGMAIIMCPGGAYSGLAMRHEGLDMASWLNAQGITYAVHAAEWGVNPQRVGIMGASAGGHLAASLATLYSSDKTRPDFQILFYPVISMQPGITHGGSRTNLLGENPSQELEQKYSLERQVSARTPQAFIMLSSDDDAVPPINGIGYFLALRDHKVPASLHAYPTGGHGWGFRDNFPYKRQWTEELEKWLREGLVFPGL